MDGRNVIEYCLTEIPTIIDAILNKLNGKDLSTASCVCWFWYTSAQRIWHKRYYPLFTLQHDPNYNKKSMCIMGRVLCNVIETASIYPSAVIMYMSRCEEYFPKRFSNHIRKLTKDVAISLPNSAKLFAALGGGIIGKNESSSYEVELCEGISSMLLPRSSEVSIHNFFLSLKDIKSGMRNIENCKGLFSCLETSNVKLVLLNACCDASVVKEAIKIIVKTFGEEVVIAGGLVESVFHQGKLYNKGISGLLFAGNLSATLIVHKTKRNQNDFIEKDKDQFFENLRTLKASVSHHQFNVIFMYACVARGHDLYSEQNVQTKWISEVMPGIPVIGMFAFGEIGYFGTRTMNDISKSSYSYSTVLCLCQF